MGGIVIEVTDSYKKEIKKLMMGWLLLLSVAILLLVINIYLIYSGKSAESKIIYQSMALVDFSIILVTTYYFLKLRKRLRHLEEGSRSHD